MAAISGIVFEQDIYLARADQTKARMKIAQWANQQGFRKFGAEFLFMHRDDAQHQDKLEQKAKQIVQQYNELFEETYFSIHFPWMPSNRCTLEVSDEARQMMQRMLEFASDSVSVVNVHFGVVPRDRVKEFDSPEKKKAALLTLSETLYDLTEHGKRVCIETIPFPNDLPENFHYSGTLPSDFALALKKNNAGMTLDTSHAGINQQQCKQMLQNGWMEGFSEKDRREITALAKDPIAPYLEEVGKVHHVHFSDYLAPIDAPYPLDGIVFGKGVRTPQEMWRQLENLRKATNQKQLGATLEINETDYIGSPNLREVLEWIRRMEGHA